eukprot:s7206_g4.t1
MARCRLGLYGAVTKAARGRPRVEALILNAVKWSRGTSEAMFRLGYVALLLSVFSAECIDQHALRLKHQTQEAIKGM